MLGVRDVPAGTGEAASAVPPAVRQFMQEHGIDDSTFQGVFLRAGSWPSMVYGVGFRVNDSAQERACLLV